MSDLKGRYYSILFVRVTLAAGYLSAVADRFGLWGPAGRPAVAWGDFHHFMEYTAKLNPWCPAGLVGGLSWTATVAELLIGLGLLVGFRTRITAMLSGLMALSFALAMTAVLGVHAPLNYSVFVVSAASFLLASVADGK